jgi:hypothetical protein
MKGAIGFTMPAARKGAFRLSVPLDTSTVGSGGGTQELRVVVKRADGELVSRTAAVRAGQKESVQFAFDEHPGPVQVIVGPASAAEHDLPNLQTISVSVSGRSWAERELVIDPVVIAPYWWWWWLEWCRPFVIRGRVVCADGSPVPGAEVCAYDIDWWWWWTSTELLGCATTAADGTFEIDFTYCCGWWPWWWWRLRVWEFEPILAETISAVLEQDPRIKLGRAGNQPGLEVFTELLGARNVGTNGPLGPENLDDLERLRTNLLAKLPESPALAAQRIWPWWPWWPWWDCNPDVIFKVTQDCNAPGTVILDESFLQVRSDFGGVLQVTLTANEQACCAQPCPVAPCVEGTCVDISDICTTPVTAVGGNPFGDPSALTPVGLLNPGADAPGSATYSGDRPYAGEVDVINANIMVGVDYYEILYSTTGAPGSWLPLPAGAAMAFTRQWAAPPVPPATIWSKGAVSFPFTNVIVSGVSHSLVESREHYEATTGLPAGAFWTTNQWLVVPIDSTKFPDGVYPAGTYYFTVVGWQEAGGVYTPVNPPWPTPLPVCDSTDPNGWVVTFNNRLDPDPGATTPCGSGTVTLCVTQPTTQIESVTLNGSPVTTCDTVEACGDLVIDFRVEDPTGYLAYYTLIAQYGASLYVDLLNRPSSTLSVVSGDYVGPTYGQALGEGATRPTWKGGLLRLTVSAAEAFPEVPCCYDLQLAAWTRTATCDGDYAYWNQSEYTIGIAACASEG